MQFSEIQMAWSLYGLYLKTGRGNDAFWSLIRNLANSCPTKIAGGYVAGELGIRAEGEFLRSLYIGVFFCLFTIWITPEGNLYRPSTGQNMRCANYPDFHVVSNVRQCRHTYFAIRGFVHVLISCSFAALLEKLWTKNAVRRQKSTANITYSNQDHKFTV